MSNNNIFNQGEQSASNAFAAAPEFGLQSEPEVSQEGFGRSFDQSQLKFGQGAQGLKIQTNGMAISGQYENELNDMAKTSMFGGHLHSAELPISPSGQRLQYNQPTQEVDQGAQSCFSVKGSSQCPSPSPTNKAERMSNAQDNFGVPGLSFLERMAQQSAANPGIQLNLNSSGIRPDDPMAHTFSSLSPKHQVSALIESKNELRIAGNLHGTEEQSFINPFSIACRNESDSNTEGEVTAEGFYKNPEDSTVNPRHTAEQMVREEASSTPLSAGQSNSRAGSKIKVQQNSSNQTQMSPFDVVLQEQQKKQITRKIVPKIVSELPQKNEQAQQAITRNSNPMGQIKKLQIVSLVASQSNQTAPTQQSTNLGQSIYKIKRSQIITNSKVAQSNITNNANLKRPVQPDRTNIQTASENKSSAQGANNFLRKDSNSLKFKKQFSRVSTGATQPSGEASRGRDILGNLSGNNQQQKKLAHERLRSIDKINEERSQLVGIKNQSSSKKKEISNDAFDVDLKVHNEFQMHDLDAVDQLRSINSVSMNQNTTSNNQMVGSQISNAGSPLVQGSAFQFMQQPFQQVQIGGRNPNQEHQVMGRKNLTQSRGNPFQPASPATNSSLKMQLQEQAAAQAVIDRKTKFLSQVKLATSQSQDSRPNKNSQNNKQIKEKVSDGMFSPGMVAGLKPGARLNSESRRVTPGTNQPFNNLITPSDFLIPGQYDSPRSNKLGNQYLNVSIGQVGNTGTPYEKQSNQFGLFLNETDPFPELLSAQQRQAMGGLGSGQNFFNNDLSIMKHSATQDIQGIKDYTSGKDHDYIHSGGPTGTSQANQRQPQSFQNSGVMGSHGGPIQLGSNRRVSVHQIVSAKQQQNAQQLRPQLQTREEQNYRKINSQGLMQPTYGGLEQYNTIEGNMSVDHFPIPSGQQHSQHIMTAHGMKRGDSVGLNYQFNKGATAGGQGQGLDIPQRQQIGRSFDNFLAQQQQQQSSQQQSRSQHSQQQHQQQPSIVSKGSVSVRPVASKNIPQVFRQNHHNRARRNGGSDPHLGSRGSMTTGSNSHMRQGTNQKQRSFSNDARIMLHESKKLEQRFAQNQHAINSLDSSLVMKMQQNTSLNLPHGGDPVGIGQGLFSPGFNDVAEFEIYDRKFKQQVTTANTTHSQSQVEQQQQQAEQKSKVGEQGRNTKAMYDTPSFQNQIKLQNLQASQFM